MDLLKRQARASTAALLGQIPPEELARQSRIVTQTVRALAAYKNASAVSIYLSMPTAELQTTPLLEQLFADGKQCYVPVAPKGGEMEMLRLWSMADYEALPRNRWGIPEPKRTDGRPVAMQSAVDLQLVLTPGVLFDSAGGRLGHGRGYYDRFIARSRRLAQETHVEPPAFVALALNEQVLPAGETVPTGPTDERVDAVVCADPAKRVFRAIAAPAADS